MSNLNPVTKLEGLFNTYEDEQVVPAKEYNANITALKKAIEHNGSVSKNQQNAIDALVVNKLPAGGVTNEYVADDTLTLDKLAPDVREQLVYTTDNYGVIFKDFINQMHRSLPTLRGSFLNGAVQSINKTLTKQLEYTKTVEQTRFQVGKKDEGYITHDNAAAPETYKIDDNYSTFGVRATWQTTCNLNGTYTINPKTDTFKFTWQVVSQIDGTGYSGSDGSATVYFKNAKGESLLELKAEYKDSCYSSVTRNFYYKYVVDLTEQASAVINGVTHIVIKTTVELSANGKYFNTHKKDCSPSFVLDMSFSTETTTVCRKDCSVPISNMLPFVALTAHVKSTAGAELDKDSLHMAPYCIGQCPHDPAPNFNKTVLGYVDETNDSKYSAECVDSTNHCYFIRHEFQAPVIISAKVSEDKPNGVQPDFAAGAYYSWPLNPTDRKSYIAYTDVASVIEALTKSFNGHLEDFTCTDYSLGSVNMALQLSTKLSNILVESIGVSQYTKFQNPIANIETTEL